MAGRSSILPRVVSHKSLYIRGNGFWAEARRERRAYPVPTRRDKERATTPPPKRHAALRVALKLAWGFVAQSVEYRWGYTPSLAPRPRPICAPRMYSYFGD